MLSNRLMLTRTVRTQMFRAESLELLARRRPRSRGCDDDPVNMDHQDNGNSRAINPAVDRHDTVPTEDPDDSIDPDDSGPRLVVTLKQSPDGETYALRAAQAEQTGGQCSDTGDQSKAPRRVPAATAGAPARPDLLDPVVLRTMPPKVAAFMLYEPREPPPWRRQESEGERAFREQCESDGTWCGL
jgi:hypothetical protein